MKSSAKRPPLAGILTVAALAALPGALPGQEEDAPSAAPAPPRQDCRLCHTETVRTLERTLPEERLPAALDCLSCHPSAAAHGDTLGVTPCDPADVAGASPFHPPSRRAALAPPLQAPSRSPLEVGAWVVQGFFQAGYRGVSGGGGSFRTFANRPPGVLLRRGKADARRPAGEAAVDHIALDITGVGDPASRGSILVEDTGDWRLRVRGDRYEDWFAATTDLHDTLSVRKSLGADLELPAADGGLRLSWTRQIRTLDAVWTRYRAISNERFLDNDGFLRETSDLFQASLQARSGEWRLRALPALRWWREQDDRFLFQANALRDDLEDYGAASRAWTPSLLLQADGPLGDDLSLETEVLGAWSARRTLTGADTAGVDAGGAAYTGRLGARTRASGDYLRAESALFWELAASAGLEFRLRWRKDAQFGRTRQAETITSGGTTTTTASVNEERSRLRTLDGELALRLRPAESLDLDLGYGARSERLRLRGANPALQRTVTHGALGRLRWQAGETLDVRGLLRAYAVGDPYTGLSPDREDLASLEADWDVLEALTLRGGASRSRTRLLADGGGADQDRQFLQVVLRPLPEGGLQAALTASRQSYAVDVLSQAWFAGFPTPYEARFAGRWLVWSTDLQWQPAAAVRLSAGGSLADTEGDDASRYRTLRGEGWYDLGEDLSLGLALWSWLFDSAVRDADDFRALAVEVLAELRF